MRPSESFLGQPVRSLQTMLRVIAQQEKTVPSLVPDGIYGPQTMQAVSVFQRNHGLSVTGITDQATWNAVVAVYEPALIQQAEAWPLEIILNPGEVIRKGQRHPHLYLVQAILQVLSEVYESVSPPTFTGMLDDITADSLASFQRLNGIPMTGDLDKITWKMLALQYPLAGNRSVSKAE